MWTPGQAEQSVIEAATEYVDGLTLAEVTAFRKALQYLRLMEKAREADETLAEAKAEQESGGA